MKIPLSAPDISETEIEAVVEVLRGTQLSRGPKVEAFEGAIARYVGVPYVVAVNSGTSAMHLCLRGLGIEAGDEVIVPSFTFVAVANAVRYERATPVFVDIEPHTLNLDPEKVEAAITPRTKAIIAVHTFGVPAEMDAIIEIARRHSLWLVEDACEAIGAEYRGHKVGTFGDAAAFGFYPNKQITTGEGGVLVTGNPELATRARSLRNHGRDEGDPRHQELGFNYRIADLNCALGLAQVGRIEGILARRAHVARKYDAALRDVPGLILPPIELPGKRISWFVYVVRLAESFTEADRDFVADVLRAAGTGSGKYFSPIHQQPAYRNAAVPYPLTVTEQVGARTLALPFFNRITDEQIDEVCDGLRAALEKVKHV